MTMSPPAARSNGAASKSDPVTARGPLEVLVVVGDAGLQGGSSDGYATGVVVSGLTSTTSATSPRVQAKFPPVFTHSPLTNS